ncbi:MAG: HDIG domain-containing metalloprotein [Candidatus Cryosericum sp.]|nr:HDIG domain-containing protein [bacterium]
MTRQRSSFSRLVGRMVHGRQFRITRFRRAGTLAVVLAALLTGALCALPFIPIRESVVAGETLSSDIVSRRDISYVDTVKTAELQKRARDDVAPIYKFDSARLPAALAAFDETVSKLLAIRAQDLPVDQQSQRIAALLMTTAGTTTKYLATCSESEIQSLQTAARHALSTVMSRGVPDGSIASARESINTELGNFGISDNQVRAAYLLAAHVVSSNLIYDQQATEDARDEAASGVPPVVATISAGTPVVRKGTVLDQNTVDLLMNTGLVWGPRAIWNMALQVLLALLAWAAIMAAVLLLHGGQERRQHVLMEVGVIGVTSIITGWLSSSVSPLITPFLLAILLGFIFFDNGLAVVFGLSLLGITCIMVPISLDVLLGVLSGAICIIVIMWKADRMTALLVAGPVGGAAGAAVYGALATVSGQQPSAIAASAGYIVAGGVLAALLALGLTFIFERLFNVATVTRLRELLDTGSRLLTQLFESAPGTYHHSLNVANLASGAAQRIGANWLLARVGGYYHDIGKLLHPQFFGENRGELPNIHEDISPELSTKVILEHVQAGVTIAASNHLPSEVVDIIAEHHGTTVVQFFYDKAAAEQINLSADMFRYQGPKPHTRESSLVFLADGIEAAARSLVKVDRSALEGLIESVVAARIADGQLAESQLTLGEIGIAKEYFLTSLISFYHVRDAYPMSEEANERI